MSNVSQGAPHKLQPDAQRYRFVVLRKSSAGNLGKHRGAGANLPRIPPGLPELPHFPRQGNNLGRTPFPITFELWYDHGSVSAEVAGKKRAHHNGVVRGMWYVSLRTPTYAPRFIL
jgi:hypothetical protein